MSAPAGALGGGGAGLAGAPSGLAGAVASAALAGVTSWVAAGATFMLHQLGAVVASSTRPELTSAWFAAHYAVMAELGAAATVPLLLAASVQGVLRQDGGMLVRSALLELPAAAVLTAAAVAVTQLALGAVDELSSKLLNGVRLAAELAPASTAGTGAPAFVSFVTALVVAGAALVLFIELAVRSAAVYAAVLFLPLALAGLVWPVTARWSRRLAETLVALVLAKLVIAGVLALAVGALAATGPGGLARAVAAVSLLVLATMAPFALLRLVPFVEAGAVGHLEGLRHRAVSAVGSRAGGLAFGSGGRGGPPSAAPTGLPMAPPEEPPPYLVALLGGPRPGGGPGIGGPGDFGPGSGGGGPGGGGGGGVGHGGGRARDGGAREPGGSTADGPGPSGSARVVPAAAGGAQGDPGCAEAPRLEADPRLAGSASSVVPALFVLGAQAAAQAPSPRG